MTPVSSSEFGARLLQRSKVYIRAYEKLDCGQERELIYPGYHLLALACELAIKGFLSAKGWYQRQLHELSHDLTKALKIAHDNGLRRVELDQELMVTLMAADGGKDHNLRYPHRYLASLPGPKECGDVANMLIEATQTTVTRSYLIGVADQRRAVN